MDDCLHCIPEKDGTYSYYGTRNRRLHSYKSYVGTSMIPTGSRFFEIDTGYAYVWRNGGWRPDVDPKYGTDLLSRYTEEILKHELEELESELEKTRTRISMDTQNSVLRYLVQTQISDRHMRRGELYKTNAAKTPSLKPASRTTDPVRKRTEREKCIACGAKLTHPVDIRIVGRRKYCAKCGCYLPTIFYDKLLESDEESSCESACTISSKDKMMPVIIAC